MKNTRASALKPHSPSVAQPEEHHFDHHRSGARLCFTKGPADVVNPATLEIARVQNPALSNTKTSWHRFQKPRREFSVSQFHLEPVKRYIATREEHHQIMNYQADLRILWRKHEVEWGGK
jgi:hypothetical protein